MKKRNLVRAIGVVAAAGVIAAVTATLVAGPALGGEDNGCPKGNLEGRPVSNLVGAYSTPNGNDTTYYFDSFVDENSTNGVPGLIRYCIFHDAGTPSNVAIGPGAVGADNQVWIDPQSLDLFWIGRPDGNPSNIPLDGILGREMGTATWNSVPQTQVILLHINDAAECAALGAQPDDGDESSTCWVLPGSSPPPPPPDDAALRIRKFYDADADGTQDAGEQDILGWQVTYNSIPALTPVDVDPIAPGDYTVAEGTPVQTNWFHTTPTSVNVTLDNGDDVTVKFGNLCVGAGGGLTLGFWSNKNGQALFGAGDLAMIVGLNLVNAGGSAFNPANYAAFRTWLLSATATNMAYMLSAQLAAMELNVFNGKVNASALIYAPGTSSANSLGFATVGAVMAEANTELLAHPLTKSGSAFRSYQEALKNSLDKANNNQNFVQTSPCPFTFAA